MARPRHLLVLILAALLTACAGSDTPGIRIADRAEMEAKLRPVFGEPIFVPSSNRVLYPFAAEGAQTGKETWGISSGGYLVVGSAASGIGSFGYGKRSGSNSLRWNNIAVVDPSSGAARLLFDRPVLICQFYMQDADNGPVSTPHLLFGVAQEDTNRDGMINADDAVVLMATDAHASGPPRLLSYVDDQLVDIAGNKHDPQWLYFRLRRDTDKDGRFSGSDRIDAFRINVQEVLRTSADGEPQRVLPDELREKAFDTVLRAAREPAGR